MKQAIEPISSSSTLVLDATGAPALSLPDGWRGLRLSRNAIPATADTGPACVTSPMLILATRGHGRRWYRFGAKTVELSTAPDMFELYASDFQRDGAHWLGEAGESVSIFLEPSEVARLAPEIDDFDVRTTHELFDPKLLWLTQELIDEAQRGAPGGALYAEGVSCALLGRLSAFYGSLRVPRALTGHLSVTSRRRVLDFIEAHLGDDIGVTDLAREAGLSPQHFSRCFKASLGVSPHRFVLKRRMEVAVKLLKSTSLTMAEIALALGFSSQSHFTQAFRQHTGTTPAAARKP